MAERKAGRKAARNGKHRLLTVEEILAADDVQRERVHVPEWGGDIILSTPTAAARARFARLWEERPEGDPLPTELMPAAMVAMSACDADGRPMFGPEHVEALAARSADVIWRLIPIVHRVNALAARVNAALEDARGN